MFWSLLFRCPSQGQTYLGSRLLELHVRKQPKHAPEFFRAVYGTEILQQIYVFLNTEVVTASLFIAGLILLALPLQLDFHTIWKACLELITSIIRIQGQSFVGTNLPSYKRVRLSKRVIPLSFVSRPLCILSIECVLLPISSFWPRHGDKMLWVQRPSNSIETSESESSHLIEHGDCHIIGLKLVVVSCYSSGACNHTMTG